MVENTGIRWRRTLRALRRQPPAIQALAAGLTLVLVVNVATVAARSGDDATPEIADVPTATGDDGSGTDGDGATTDGGTADGGATDPSPGDGPGDTGDGSDGAVAPGDGGTDDGATDTGATDTGATDGGTTDGSGTDGGGTDGGGTTDGGATDGTTDGPTEQPRTYTASDRGVTAETVKIAFPWFDLAATFAVTGTGNDDIENAENVINAMVEWINANGGVDGRLIDPIVEEYNPLNETDMRNKCIRWSQDEEVFGVVDAGGWHTQHQLCLTQENDTPLISEWTTVEEWTERGAPYLWWTAASAEETIENLLLWLQEADLVPADQPLGVLVADRESDKLAHEFVKRLNEQHLGLNLHIEVIPYDNATAQATVPQAVQRMRTAGVTRVVGLLPVTTMAFWLSGAESQNYYPHYVLSDYETNLVTAQALLGAQFPRSLDGAIGPTAFPLGQVDDPSNYRPAEKFCNDVWKAQSPESEDLDIGGVGMRWCQNIFLFVEAASAASASSGGTLTRDGWAEAMGQIRDRPSQMTPTMSFSPTDRSGPTTVKVVEIETRDCSEELDDDGNGVCHLQVSGYQPYRTV